MGTFSAYQSTFKLTCEIGLLDSGFMNNAYSLFQGTTVISTPGGHPISHPSEAVIRMIMTDLQLSEHSANQALKAPLLFSFMKDFPEAGKDPIDENRTSVQQSDLFIVLKTQEKPPFQPYAPHDPLFSFAFNTLSGLVASVNEFSAGVLSEIKMEDSEEAVFPEIVYLYYSKLANDKKAVINALYEVHHAGIVLPLLLIAGEISPGEYIKALISLRLADESKVSVLSSDLLQCLSFIEVMSGRRGKITSATALIKAGEGDACEFKSTLRWDLRAGKTNPAIERAVLKTIAAFLNSSGGHLLIGVRDDGGIEGIESDRFPNEDKFLLHLWMLIRSCLGRDFTPYIHSRLEKVDNHTLCVISCEPAGRPVFLRQPGFPEEMYIRLGPSSNALNISEALVYIADRFGKEDL